MTILGITCQKDDGPFLVEWLAHHLAHGFDRMLVLSHDCSDGSDTLLRALAQDPRITHVPFEAKGRKSVQWQALKHVADHPLYQGADWALFFDCDEYFCGPDVTVPLLIDAISKSVGAFDALALPWRLFGSAGHVRASTELTAERFTRAAPKDLHFPLGHLFKTLHKPGAFQKPGVHRPRSKKTKPARWVDPVGRPMPKRFAEQDGAITLYGMTQGEKLAWLNHYSLRSREEFMVKRARGLPNHADRDIGVTYWAERDWNSVQDRSILPMMDATKAELAKLLAMPNVASALRTCRDWHAQTYQSLMQDIENVRLEFRLGFLSGSRPPTAEEGLKFMHLQSALLAKSKA